MTTYGHDDGHNKIVIPTKAESDALAARVTQLESDVTDLRNNYSGVQYSYASWHPFDIVANMQGQVTGLVQAGAICATVNSDYSSIKLEGTNEIKQNPIFALSSPIHLAYWGINLDTIFDSEHLNIAAAFPDPTNHPEWNWQCELPSFPNESLNPDLAGFGGSIRYYCSGWAQPDPNVEGDTGHRAVVSENKDIVEGLSQDYGVRTWSCAYNMSHGCFKYAIDTSSNNTKWLLPSRIFFNTDENKPGCYNWELDWIMPNTIMDWEVTLRIRKPREEG